MSVSHSSHANVGSMAVILRPDSRILGGILLAAVFMAFVSFDRLYRIGDIGVDGCDTFFYLNTARDWAQGNVSLTAHYRPVTHLLDSVAFRLGRGGESSVRLMHAVLDIGTVAVLLSLMLAMSRNVVVSIAASAMYATLPVVIERSARSEVSTGPSTFFIVLCMSAFYMAMRAYPKRSSLLWVFALGIACSISANTHPDLVMAGPGFSVAIVAYVLIAVRPVALGRMALLQTALGAGFVLPFVAIVWHFGCEEVKEAIAWNARREAVGLVWKAEVFWRFLALVPKDFFAKYTGEPFPYAFAAAFVINLAVLARRKGPMLIFATMGIPLAFHVLGYACMTQGYRPATVKLFIPWLPWIMSWTAWCLYQLKYLRLFRERRLSFWSVFLACVFVLLFVNRRHYRYTLFVSVKQPVAVYREAYDALKHRVSEKNRVLFAPTTLYARRYPAAQWVYFGENGTYIRKSKGRGLEDVMKREKARFLAVFRKRIDRRIEGRRDFGPIIKRLYGIENRKRYSLKREYRILASFASQQGATILHRSRRVAIYEFP